jgi:hypothetical protein
MSPSATPPSPCRKHLIKFCDCGDVETYIHDCNKTIFSFAAITHNGSFTQQAFM